MRPTVRCLWLLGALILPALLPTWANPGLWIGWAAALAALVFAVVLDWQLAASRSHASAGCTLPTELCVGEPEAVTVNVRLADARGPVRVVVRLELDHGPIDPALGVQRLVAPLADTVVVLPGGESAALPVTLVPQRRGRLELSRIALSWRGPLGLIELMTACPLAASVPVIPNIRTVRRAAVQLALGRSFDAGFVRQHFSGDGSEFDELREYVPGYDPRQLDWRASARHRKLLCRVNQTERDTHVVIAFDTGPLMGEPVAGLPKLDHAINAGLLLTYLGLRAGDKVGLFAFDADARLYIAPRGGVSSFPSLQARTAELRYGTQETNFTLGMVQLLGRLRRRSLVVVLTDFVDSVTAAIMAENLGRLARRHVVVFLSIRDPSLESLTRAEPRSELDLHRAGAARDLLDERERVLKQLGREGIFCIDALPASITANLLNKYLFIKQRELV